MNSISNTEEINLTKMTLEDQVVSLELAKRLKELGVKQESYFWWHIRKYKEPNTPNDVWVTVNTLQRDKDEEIYSAFTVAELLEISPASTSMLKRTDIETNAIPRYYVETFEHYRESDWNENPANALAKMLIYLIENELSSQK